jgi:hypothetical protein
MQSGGGKIWRFRLPLSEPDSFRAMPLTVGRFTAQAFITPPSFSFILLPTD